MKILVDELPEKPYDCIFNRDGIIKDGKYEWTCWFLPSHVCKDTKECFLLKKYNSDNKENNDEIN